MALLGELYGSNYLWTKMNHENVACMKVGTYIACELLTLVYRQFTN